MRTIASIMESRYEQCPNCFVRIIWGVYEGSTMAVNAEPDDGPYIFAGLDDAVIQNDQAHRRALPHFSRHRCHRSAA